VPVERLPGIQTGRGTDSSDVSAEEEVRRGLLLTTMDKAVS
jgi:hypothetical protein